MTLYINKTDKIKILTTEDPHYGSYIHPLDLTPNSYIVYKHHFNADWPDKTQITKVQEQEDKMAIQVKNLPENSYIYLNCAKIPTHLLTKNKVEYKND